MRCTSDFFGENDVLVLGDLILINFQIGLWGAFFTNMHFVCKTVHWAAPNITVKNRPNSIFNSLVEL